MHRSSGLPRRLRLLAARAGEMCGLALLLAAAAGAGPGFAARGAGAAAPPRAIGPAAAAMAGAERYCTRYEHTFHGAWTPDEQEGAPVLFRVGANTGADRRGCYAQLNVMADRGIAPYELPRFRVEKKGGVWTLRYRTISVTLDPERGTAVHRQGEGPPRTGRLLARPPPIGSVPPAPPARRMERWYGRWRGRFAGLPFPVTLRFSGAGTNEVEGRISGLLMSRSFKGRFHGEMLVFRWRNRHVGLVMEEDGDSLVHVNYRGQAYRFHRRGG